MASVLSFGAYQGFHVLLQLLLIIANIKDLISGSLCSSRNVRVPEQTAGCAIQAWQPIVLTPEAYSPAAEAKKSPDFQRHPAKFDVADCKEVQT